MNFGQCVSLWYGGLATAAVFLYYAYTRKIIFYIIPAIIVLTLLFTYTLRTTSHIDKKRLLKCVGLPIIIIMGLMVIINIIKYNNRMASKNNNVSGTYYGKTYIDPALIKISDTKIEIIKSGSLRLVGKVKNESDNTVISVKIKVIIHDKTGDRQSSDVYIGDGFFSKLLVPPKETRAFTAPISNIDWNSNTKTQISCDVISVEGLSEWFK